MKTTTLEQSKKLYELGVEVRAEKDWRKDYKGNATVVRNYGGTRKPEMGVSYLPAYDAEELIGMIKDSGLELYRFPAGTWQICGEYGEPIYGATLTEALANKLIYDIENGIVSIEEVNK